MRRRVLGWTGLKISEFSLGVATFGSRWGAHWTMSRSDAARVLDCALDHGIDHVDTSNVYNQGESEAWLGELLRRPGCRDRLTVATKFGYRTSPTEPHSAGCGRSAMNKAVDSSLRRLGIDTIDLLYVHLWDMLTPPEETLSAAAEIVTAGKIRYLGLSNVPGWYLGSCDALGSAISLPRPAAVQLHHNLLVRGHEGEFYSFVDFRNTGLVCWGPLANGLLTGRYAIDRARRTITGAGRLTETFSTGSVDPFDPVSERVLGCLAELSAETGHPPARLALAWLLTRRQVSTVLLGVSSEQQLVDNLAAADLALPDEVVDRLNRASDRRPEHPWTFLTPEVQSLVHGPQSMSKGAASRSEEASDS
jgi:aryl-alcohol dehydrogenase-like predicted oxidoreductase